MDLSLSDEQLLLQESAQRFIAREYPFDARQRSVQTTEGFNREKWAQFAELGWLAIALPVEQGGLGGCLLDVALIAEALGRGLVVEPYLSAVVVAGGTVVAADHAGARSGVISSLAEGKMLLTLAHAEPGARFDLAHIKTRAKAVGPGFVLRGQKCVVANADTADSLIVSARTSGSVDDREGITLFMVPAATSGLRMRGYPTTDGHRAAEVVLDGLRVGSDAVIGEIGGALPALEYAVDRAAVIACAEAIGAMDILVEMTTDYLKTRVQFGVPLSGFQALQHRAVDMYIQQQLSRALVYRAAATWEPSDRVACARTASTVKAQVGRSARRVGKEAIQLHGGMGMTDELPIGHHFKRLCTLDTLFGNVDHHLDRLAASAHGEAITREIQNVPEVQKA